MECEPKLFRPWDDRNSNETQIKYSTTDSIKCMDLAAVKTRLPFVYSNYSCYFFDFYLPLTKLMRGIFDQSVTHLTDAKNLSHHLMDDTLNKSQNQSPMSVVSPSMQCLSLSSTTNTSLNAGTKSTFFNNSNEWFCKLKRQRPKRFNCPHCEIAFSNNGQLKGHIRTHTGERPFICDHPQCGKSFTRNEELTRHRRIHSGIRPYSCIICSKRFGRKDHLKKHQRIHERRLCNVNVVGGASTSVASGSSMALFHMMCHMQHSV